MSSSTDEKSPSTTNLPETKLWAHTKSTTFKIEFNWTIDNFSFYLESDPKEFIAIKSPEYSAPGHDDVRFYLNFHPNNEKKENKDHLALYFHCSKLPSPICAKYKMSFVDSEGKDRHFRDYQYKFIKIEGFGTPKMLARSVLLDPANGLLPNDQLTIRCEAIICFINENKSSLSIVRANSDEYEKQFSVDMVSLIENAKYSDVTLSVDGIELPAHKNILSCRSPVFDAMFSHQNTKEVREGKVKIDDVPADVFQDLLRFIYTGKVPAEERLTTELLAAADKYQVEGLKSACENHLSTSLSIKSVATFLLFADMHNAASLKVNCIKYLSDNIFAVMSTEAWLNMAKLRPELMLEISNLSIKKTVAQEGSK